MTERGAERMPDRLPLLADPQPVLPGVGVLLADLLEEVGADGHRDRWQPPWQQRPLAAEQIVVRAEPYTVLRRDVGGDIAEIGEVVEVEVSVAEPGAEGRQVVPGSRLDLRSLLGLQLQVRNDVEPDLHLVLCAPLLELALQFLVGLRHKARNGEEGELAGLRIGRRLAQGEYARKACGAARRRAQELPPSRAARIGDAGFRHVVSSMCGAGRIASGAGLRAVI